MHVCDSIQSHPLYVGNNGCIGFTPNGALIVIVRDRHSFTSHNMCTQYGEVGGEGKATSPTSLSKEKYS
ncbi:hypothetical protein BD310DRAFT_936452 [Dichomitus squalens]|uniref:Uncharacterized protein n=1 Tax=Dichomitus squalens TaxID=114155 RepID=A0A4Q9PJG6_9APHY|nr:hypothetical protein BD310DRAFT_936452 [Dichomitus squalens]